MATDEPRAARLHQFFNKVIQKNIQLTKSTYKQFIEAICAQPDPPTCINKIKGSAGGLVSVQAATQFDLSPDFCNGLASKLIRYLSSPELRVIGDGALLRDVLHSMVEPPIFWNAFTNALTSGKLNSEGQFGYAWLLSTLISLLPLEDAADFRRVARNPEVMKPLFDSPSLEVRNLAHRIKHSVAVFDQGGQLGDQEAGPGGRHDNDYVDFRQISIVPTADEIQSTLPAFIRPSVMFGDEETKEAREAVYYDNQFRLLREDILYEIRDEIAAEQKRKNHRSFAIDGLKLVSVHYRPPGDKRRGIRWAIVLQCSSDLWQLRRAKLKSPERRKKWLQDNRNVLKHQSMACLIVNQELVTLAIIERDEDLLAHKPPRIVLRIEGVANITRALMQLKTAETIKLVQINAAMFAYQPILQALKESRKIPFSRELLLWSDECQPQLVSNTPIKVIQYIEQNHRRDLRPILRTTKSIVLDMSQSASLLTGLTQRVSLIQGPPGTGKSFIGALLAKALHKYAGSTILVVCYTNHALDQFLEDLMDIGIPQSSMVRLGGKSTDRTKNLSLQHILQHSPLSKLTKADWREINPIKAEIRRYRYSLAQTATKYQSPNPTYDEIMEFLKSEDPDYYSAFALPASVDGQTLVGKKGKALSNTYLINQWKNGWDAGALRNHERVKERPSIWGMKSSERKMKFARWKEAMLRIQVQTIQELAQKHDRSQTRLDAKFEARDRAVVASRQIIGCTTTAAAKYREYINAAKPSVLLVEEAGEILESHVLTALAPTVKQLILIGDHKQLRPKVNNYLLTVEKGEGYDLNRSLFERLVLRGYPHSTLSQQHRMRPEISALVRHLTYPELLDAESTKGRPDIRGLTSNVVFIHHNHREDDLPQASHLMSPPDETSSKSSKSNKHEVEMVLKVLRYLGQQGYQTNQVVILTPYLGQLRALQDALKKDNDPILNDLDHGDLVRAGLVTAAEAQEAKKPIRLATIDNYQGEESDIVIASLTRSNPERKIGFMSASERVNVLLSRARDGLIMIGDANTFLEAKGSKVWPRLFELLKERSYIFSGLPVKCEKHPGRTALLECPEDFDQKSPDGGCMQPCGVTLKCTIHTCPSKCHQLIDHSKMKCEVAMYTKCPKGHLQQFKCNDGPADVCTLCKDDAKKRKRAEIAAHQKREGEQRSHDQQIAEIEAQTEQKCQALRDAPLAEGGERAIEQRRKDPEAVISAGFGPSRLVVPPTTSMNVSGASREGEGEPSTPSTNPARPPREPQMKSTPKPPPQANPLVRPVQPTPPLAEMEWKRQNKLEAAKNDAIDEIMQIGGLEKVKRQVFNIKSKVEITNRQGGSLKDLTSNVEDVGLVTGARFRSNGGGMKA